MPPINQYPVDESDQNTLINAADSLIQYEKADRLAMYKRTRREEEIKHWSFVVFVWSVTISVIIAFLLTTWHTLTPETWQWLDDNHLTKIHQFLATGVLSGSAGLFFQSRLENNPISRLPK
jgi:hypothetical protein